VPAKTPKPIREKLAAEITRILALQDVKDAFAAIGANPESNTPDQMDAMLKSYVANTRKLTDEMHITVD
jgi:tripartite-type tricarboxylate transporter receptor subunit TctC